MFSNIQFLTMEKNYFAAVNAKKAKNNRRSLYSSPKGHFIVTSGPHFKKVVLTTHIP